MSVEQQDDSSSQSLNKNARNTKNKTLSQTSLIAIATALFAIVPPVTTAIYGNIKGSNDYRLAQQAQEHEKVTYYLQKAIEPPREVTRVRYLRYLVETSSDQVNDA